MKRQVILAIVLAALCLPTYSQTVNTVANSVRQSSSTPSGSCSPRGSVRINGNTIYVCPQSGTANWTAVSGGGGSVSIGSAVGSGAAGSWLKIDSSGNLAQTRFSDQSCYNCLRGLKHWNAALTNSGIAAAKIAFIGDSITAGTAASPITNSYVNRLTRLLQNLYGAGTSEAIWRGGSSPDSRWTLTSGTWATGSVGGPGGLTLSSTNSSDRLTISSVYGDTLEIYTVNSTDTSGSFAVTIDGGSDNTISQSTTGSLATSQTVRNTVSMGSLGNHTVVIKGPSSGSLYVAGIAGRIGSTGVRVYPFGYSGSRSTDWSSSTDNRDQALAAYVPNLTVIAVGSTNDYYYQTVPATFKTNIERIITEVQAISPTASILLLVENPMGAGIFGGGSATYQQSEYIAKLYELADTYNCAVVDMYNRWGDDTYQQDQGLTTDHIHPTNLGHADYFRAMTDALVQGGTIGDPLAAQTITGTMRTTNLGVDNVRLGVFSGTPAVYLENSGVVTWSIDAAGVSSGLRFIKDGATAPMELDGSGNLSISGNLTASGSGNTKFNTLGGSFGIGVSGTPSGLQVGTSVNTSALGVGNVRLGLNGGTPSLLLETTASGGSRWIIDNVSGTFRWVFNASSVPMQLTSTGLTIGSSGTELKSIFSGSASLDFAQASANTCETLTLTVTGAVDGQPVSIGVPHALANHNTSATFTAWRSASNTVSVRRCVISADGSDPAAATVRVSQFSH